MAGLKAMQPKEFKERAAQLSVEGEPLASPKARN